MTERWPASRKYRDLFEAVKKSVLDALSEGQHNPRTAVTSMKGDMHASIQCLQVDPTTETVPDDLEQMISDMTGEQISFWDDMDMTDMGDTTAFVAPVDDASQTFGIGTGWESTDRSFWFNEGGNMERQHDSVVP